MKTCNRCHIEKPKTEFYSKKTSKDGLFWWCRTCHKESMKSKYHNLAKDETYRNQERKRMNEFWSLNPEIKKKCSQEYARKNKGKVNASTVKRRLAKINRTPKWLTADDFWMIEQAYEMAVQRTKLFGFQWQVDHILPLQGKLVSGLHTPYNLQVIPAQENRSKSNRFAVN